jgi:hypothetical protein
VHFQFQIATIGYMAEVEQENELYEYSEESVQAGHKKLNKKP